MSSRENPKVICVRSLVPNEKNCASVAISSAVRAPRGTSIIVPTRYLILISCSFITSAATRSTMIFWSRSSLTRPTSGIMTSGSDLEPFLRQLAGRLEDGPRLHLGDLGIRDAEPHAAVAEHRVELVQLLDAVQQGLLRGQLGGVAARGLELRDLDHQVFALRQELVQRRIDRADGDRLAVHGLEHAVEVAALQRQQLGQRGPAVLLVVGEDHALHLLDAALAEEHVLGAAQPDAAGAERVRQLGLVRLVGVGADAERADLVGPAEQRREAPVDVRLLRLHLAGEHLEDLARPGGHLAELHFAREPVEGEPVAFLHGLARRR